MRAQQHALEARQLAVELDRRPLTGTVAVSTHRPHDSFDGGGPEKLDTRKGGSESRRDAAARRLQTSDCRVSTSAPITTRINPSVTSTAEWLIASFCSSSVAQRIRRKPKPGNGSIVGAAVRSDSAFIRIGPRLPTKKPETIRKHLSA